MKIYTIVVAVLVSISVSACGESDDNPNLDNPDNTLPSSSSSSENIPVTQLEYDDTAIVGEDSSVGTLQAAPAFSDIASSAHGTFVKMPAGFVSSLHTHTGTYYAVVISGVAVNTAPGGEEKRLPVGSYWLQEGNEDHVTKCISSNECIFFMSQSIPFDIQDANSNEISSTSSSENIDVTQLSYGVTGITGQDGTELQTASAFGDIENGAHGTFVKMPAGFVSNIHSHSGEYYSVVIAGVAVNTTPGGDEVELPAGSYWSQEGGEDHVTKCISSNECIFFMSQSVAFN